MSRLFLVASCIVASSVAAQSPAVSRYSACPPGELLSSDYAVTSAHDEFEGTTIYSSSAIPLEQRNDDKEFSMAVGGYTGRKEPFYSLTVMYVGKDGWVFIDKDRPMLLLMDGKKLSLTAVGSPVRDVWESGHVYESQMYQVSPATLARLAKANVVKIRVSGEKYIPDFTLPAKGTCAIGRFVSERFASSK